MSTPTRSFIRTAQVRANDLRSDDVVLLQDYTGEKRWRALFEVYRNGEDVLAEFSEDHAQQVVDRAEKIRLDVQQDVFGGRGKYAHDVRRPGMHPVLLEGESLPVTTHTSQSRSNPKLEGAVGSFSAAEITYALLGTEQYVAVRYKREESSDGSQIDDGWALFQAFAPVTVLVPCEQSEG